MSSEHSDLTEKLEQAQQELLKSEAKSEALATKCSELEKENKINLHEKQEALARLDAKQKEFVADLNSYQADNDKEVSEKMESYNQQLLEAESLQKENERKRDELR